MRAGEASMTNYDGGLGEVFLDELDRFSLDRQRFFWFRAVAAIFFQAPK